MLIQQHLLGVMPPETFIRTYLDRQPCILKGASRLPDCLDIEGVDDYLHANEGHLHLMTRVLVNGQDAIIQPNPSFSTETQKAIIDRHYRQGATIKVEQYETRHPLVARLCREIESQLGGSSYAMTFLTPPGHQGFPIHFDPVSSFIVQLAGKKRWRVYPEYVQSPTKEMNHSMVGVPLGEPMLDLVLEEGDLLYLPAGFPHEAECGEHHSLHMTFGITPHRALNVLRYALQVASERSLILRRPLHPNDANMRETVSAALQEAMDLLGKMDMPTLLRSYHNAYNSTRQDAFRHGLRNATLAAGSSIESWVRGVAHKPYTLTRADAKLVITPASTLRPGMPTFTDAPTLQVPSVAAQEVETLLGARAPVRVRELPGPLDAESKLGLAIKLASHGLVEFVDPPQA